MLSLARTRAFVAVLSIAALCAVAVGAQAASVKATGGTTTLTPSTQAAGALTAAGVTLAPIAPATASGGALVFPIKRGHFNANTLKARLFHSGGLAISNGKSTVRLRNFVINSTKKGGALFATTRVSVRRAFGPKGHRRHRVIARIVLVKLATLTNPVKSSDGTSVTVNVKASKTLAAAINRLAKKHLVSAGDAIGTATVAPTAS